jgi:hypothetical protein
MPRKDDHLSRDRLGTIHGKKDASIFLPRLCAYLPPAFRVRESGVQQQEGTGCRASTRLRI